MCARGFSVIDARPRALSRLVSLHRAKILREFCAVQALQFEMDARDNPATILPVNTVISSKAWVRVVPPRDRRCPRSTLELSRRRSSGGAALRATPE